MKTAISIPDNLFRKADQYAKNHGYSRSELFAKAVEQYLEIHPSDHITKQLNEVYSSGDKSFLSEKVHILSNEIIAQVDEGLKIVLKL